MGLRAGTNGSPCNRNSFLMSLDPRDLPFGSWAENPCSPVRMDSKCKKFLELITGSQNGVQGQPGAHKGFTGVPG